MITSWFCPDHLEHLDSLIGLGLYFCLNSDAKYLLSLNRDSFSCVYESVPFWSTLIDGLIFWDDYFLSVAIALIINDHVILAAFYLSETQRHHISCSAYFKSGSRMRRLLLRAIQH